jgi:hypothetical protein
MHKWRFRNVTCCLIVSYLEFMWLVFISYIFIFSAEVANNLMMLKLYNDVIMYWSDPFHNCVNVLLILIVDIK